MTLARLQATSADQRRDGLHQRQLTTRRIGENHVICVEALALKALVRHPKVATRISDVG